VSEVLTACLYFTTSGGGCLFPPGLDHVLNFLPTFSELGLNLGVALSCNVRKYFVFSRIQQFELDVEKFKKAFLCIAITRQLFDRLNVGNQTGEQRYEFFAKLFFALVVEIINSW
jgi:hypothetical protein